MTCGECQAQIFEREFGRDALVHLTGCEECRALDREVRLNAEALAAMRDEVMPVRRARRWPWVAAAAAAAVLVAAIGLVDQTAEPAPPAPVARMQAAAPALPVPVVKQATPRVRRARVAKPPQPLLVKFLTDDPDVVIYWLVDSIQGEQAL